MKKKLISIISPVFNEEDNINYFYKKIIKIIKKEKKYNFELLFLNNCSTDNTLSKIKILCNLDKKIRLITYSRNFGRNNSIYGGLKNSKGDFLFLVDVDCQDPPELLSTFLRKAELGYKVIYGLRDRRNESLVYYILGKIYYRFIFLFSDSQFIIDMGEFCLIHKDVKDSVISIKTDKPYIRAEIAHAGFKRIGITYLRLKRLYEKSKFNFLKAVFYGVSGFLSTSTYLLRVITYFGVGLFFYNLGYFFLSYKKNLEQFNILYIIFSLAIICIYLARTHNNVVSRKIYLIDKKNSLNNNKYYD
jgi:dolichol-phosphate mannosyltransferase